MFNSKITEKIHWNIEWIISHTLEESRLEKAGISKLHNDEIFVRYPDYPDYWVSQYGRIISTKFGKARLLKVYLVGEKVTDILDLHSLTDITKRL